MIVHINKQLCQRRSHENLFNEYRGQREIASLPTAIQTTRTELAQQLRTANLSDVRSSHSPSRTAVLAAELSRSETRD